MGERRRHAVAAWTIEQMLKPVSKTRRGAPRRRLAFSSGGEQQMLTICRTLMGKPEPES